MRYPGPGVAFRLFLFLMKLGIIKHWKYTIHDFQAYSDRQGKL